MAMTPFIRYPEAGSERKSMSNDSRKESSDGDEERQRRRANATYILQVSHTAEILRELNRALLKSRGWFDEYDSGVIMKWGTGQTRRHLWVHIDEERIRIRLREHRPCGADTTIASCDGEYHTYDPELWRATEIFKEELKYYYDHPVAESSED
jgi:hypothetical protein